MIVLVGATTENPYFSLTAPLLSRSTLFRLEAVGADDLRVLVERALTDEERGLGDEHLTIAPDALDHLVDHAEGDARHTLTSLDVAAALASEAGSTGHRARARGDRARHRARCVTAMTSTTTSSPRSSRASAAPTSMPACTGSRA